MSDYAHNFKEYSNFFKKFVCHDLQIFDISKSAKLVDIGCGFGDEICKLHDFGYANVSGIEPDIYAVKKCVDNNLDVRQGSIDKTGCRDVSFEAVLVNCVFHHVSDYDKALKEIHRILKPGGYLCFIEPHPSWQRHLLDLLTFKTPLPMLVHGFKMRRTTVGEEIATGLYPQWLREYNDFLKLVDNYFELLWLRKGALFCFGKARKRDRARNAQYGSK